MYLFLARYLTFDPVVYPRSEVMIDKGAVWQGFDKRRIPVNSQNLRAIALFLQHGAGGTCLSGRLAVCLNPPWVASLLRCVTEWLLTMPSSHSNKPRGGRLRLRGVSSKKQDIKIWAKLFE